MTLEPGIEAILADTENRSDTGSGFFHKSPLQELGGAGVCVGGLEERYGEGDEELCAPLQGAK